MKFNHICEKIYSGDPKSIARLAKFLESKYLGSRKKYEWHALATVITSSNEGHVSGFWGEISWKHEDGQFESGDVHLNIS